MNTDIDTVDEFISSFPGDIQIMLEKIRAAIHEVAPDAKEKIGYGIPTFTLNGKNLIHFSAYKKHIGLYPGSNAIAVFAKELDGYNTSKGTIQLPLDKPLPLELIQKITKHCVEQNLSRQ